MVGSDRGCGQVRWFRSSNMAVLLLALSVLAPSCGFKALAAEAVVDA
jgi:iron complex transport system substrate-binding protein